MPYRDFPIHHLPNLMFLHAALGRLSPAPFLNARVFSVVLAAATFVLIFLHAWRRNNRAGGWRIGGVAACLLLLSPLFEYTSGRAWNHAMPTLLAGAAGLRGWAGSDMLLGLAAGTRLTNHFAAAPFLALILAGQSRDSRSRPAGAFLADLAGRLLPTLVLLLLAPLQFLYGNVVYPILNARHRHRLWNKCRA